MATKNKPTGAARSSSKTGSKAGTPRRDAPEPEARSGAGDYLVPGILAVLLVGALFAYSKVRNRVPPEPPPAAGDSSGDRVAPPSARLPAPSPAPAAAPQQPRPAPPAAPSVPAQDVGVNPTHPEPTTPDPLHGQFTLQQATAGLPAGSALVADIQTSMGTFNCSLMVQEAPMTVANFVGLARGLRDFWDPVAGRWVRRPFFDGSVFHRVIPDFMIQGGDILRNGHGGPGYSIPDENVNTHEAGMLSMANHGPNTGGSQFFILEAARPNLNGSYSTFGRCTPTDLVGRIARVPVQGTTPITPVYIQSVRIHR